MQENLVPLCSISGSDTDALVSRTLAYIANCRAVNTIRGYTSDWTDFALWTIAHRFCALPAEPTTVALYLTDRSATLAAATLARRLAAISARHRDHNLPSPALHPVVVATFRGIRRTIGTAQAAKDPLLTEDVIRILAACPDTLSGLRDKALLSVSFAAAMRRSESAALQLEDVQLNAVGMALTLRRSKTDQEAEGRKVGVKRTSHPETCSVRAVEAWIDGARIRSGYLLRAVDQAGRVSHGLHPDSIACIIKRAAERAGFAPEEVARLAGHSLRSGHVTQATLVDLPDHLIRQRTGHKSAKMLDRYRRQVEVFPRHPAASLGL
jgi:integrase